MGKELTESELHNLFYVVGRMAASLERLVDAEERRNEQIEADAAQRAAMFEKDMARRDADMTRMLDGTDAATIRPSDWRQAGWHTKGPACAVFKDHEHISPEAIRFMPDKP